MTNRLPEVKYMGVDRSKVGTVHTLRCGGKILEVEFTPKGVIEGWLEKDPSFRREEGETTALLLRAKEIMVEEADRLGRPLVFKYETKFERMKTWWRMYGIGIFGCDRTELKKEDPTTEINYSTIFPTRRV